MRQRRDQYQVNRCINLKTGQHDQIRVSKYISKYVQIIDGQEMLCKKNKYKYQIEMSKSYTNSDNKLKYQILIPNSNSNNKFKT